MDPQFVEALVHQVTWLLLGAALVGMLARWLHVPYAVALVLGGLLIEESHLVAVPRLDPSVVLFAFLPPLLFDAAFRLDARELGRVVRPVLILAIPGVLVTATVVGIALALAGQVSLTVGLLLGSIVAATDPVAVTAVFKQLRVPSHLAAIVEGESLINDGVAITLYTAILGLTLTGSIELPAIAVLFGREVLGGLLIGGVAGVLCSRLTGTIDDHLVEMMLSTALAYGSYLLAHAVGASGPLACVAAGLIHGSYGRQVGMSANTRALLDDLWEYLGFLANGLVFLLVGFSVSIAGLLAYVGPMCVALVAVLGRVCKRRATAKSTR